MSENSDAETAIEASDQIIHLDAELEEDIGAEIEDLILLRRLGYNEDALEVIAAVLLRHVHHFPVFAEVSAYLLYRNDFKMLDDVCSSLRQPESAWESKEIAYLEYVVRKKNERFPPIDDGYVGKGVQLDPIGLQVLEVYLHTAPGRILHPTTSLRTVGLLVTLFNELFTQNLYWDAANIFRKFCEHYPIRKIENAETNLILDLYNNQAVYSKSASFLLEDLERDFEAHLPSTLAILSAKTALMLYIVRIYDAEIEVLVKFVLAGMPPLRTLNEEVQAISRMLSARLGFDYARNDYNVFGEACMNYWKHSESCAATVRRLNEQIRRFTSSLRPARKVPEIVAVPFEDWLRQPPVAVQ